MATEGTRSRTAGERPAAAHRRRGRRGRCSCCARRSSASCRSSTCSARRSRRSGRRSRGSAPSPSIPSSGRPCRSGPTTPRHGRRRASACTSATASSPRRSRWRGSCSPPPWRRTPLPRSGSSGSRLVFAVFLATLIIPESVYLIPNFILITRLGWYDTLAGLTVPFMASAFSIFLLRQFFAQLPNELLESARMDGAGHLAAPPVHRPAALGAPAVHRGVPRLRRLLELPSVAPGGHADDALEADHRGPDDVHHGGRAPEPASHGGRHDRRAPRRPRLLLRAEAVHGGHRAEWHQGLISMYLVLRRRPSAGQTVACEAGIEREEYHEEGACSFLALAARGARALRAGQGPRRRGSHGRDDQLLVPVLGCQRRRRCRR